MYGRETFMRLASSVWETPSCFIRRSIWRRNAEQIWSIVVIRSQGSGGRSQYAGVSTQESVYFVVKSFLQLAKREWLQSKPT